MTDDPAFEYHKAATIPCPEHEERGCVTCGGTGRVEAASDGKSPWWTEVDDDDGEP